MKIRISPLTAALATAILVVPGTAAAKSRSAGTVQLDGVRTTLTTDPATTGVLLSNGILPLPVGPATVSPQFGPHGLSLAYAFPITSGRVDATTLAGYINHSGGLRFVNAANGHTLTLTRFRIRISAKPGLTAEVNRNPKLRVRILDLDLGSAGIARRGRIVRVSNVKATLTQTAASALNRALGVSAFSKGIALGTARVTAHVG
jgi:Htaa